MVGLSATGWLLRVKCCILPQISQARKIQLTIWSSEDDRDTKTGRPQPFVVVLRCILFPGQYKYRKNK